MALSVTPTDEMKTLTVGEKIYEIVDDQAREDVSEVKADLSELPADGVTANSKQLLSENGTDNTEPYTFRAVPVNADRAELDAVVGGTVAWNQFANFSAIPSAGNGITYSSVDGKSVTFSGTANALEQRSGWFGILEAQFSTKVGHNILMLPKIVSGSFENGTITYSLFGTKWRNFSTPCVVKVGATASEQRIVITVESGTVANDFTVTFICVDLTQMFGSTIADYIYSLERSTAGAGVAFFRKYYPNDYYPYDAGTLKSVEGVSAHEMVGFNQWDEVAEVGTINLATGRPIASANQIRSKNYVKVLPNTTYFVCMKNATATNSQNGYFSCYDIDKNWLGWDGSPNHYMFKNGTFTTPSNCAYIRFYLNAEYGTTYNHDICINLSDPAKNGTYESYVKHSYALDPTVELRGIPKLADGRLTYDGDRYLPDGTVERNYGIRAYQSGDENLVNAITDGTNTVYKLTTSTIETATPYQSLQVCDPNGTEEFVSTGIVPVGHETFYPENLRAKIEGLPWDFSTLIAPTETGTASRNYTVGSLLIMSNILYKVTANIANGGAITPGTNVTATTLSEVISALQ